MALERKKFSKEEGIAIQTEDLKGWKLVLNEKVYNMLEEHAFEMNKQDTDGFGVFRGSDMSCFVSNISTQLANK